MSDPDWMPGMPCPEGDVPPEPPGAFTPEMHTHVDPAIDAVIAFLRRDYSIHLQPVTVRRLLDVVDRARLG